jgi:pimeloyl-ACP methyl ester carboxylesterase
MTEFLPVFTSPQGETKTLQAYQSMLDRWTAPYSELDISTRFGDTHVIASGPETAPPVVLLHALFATATSWYRNAGALSQHYRTFAVDMMGEANKSRPTRPIKSPDDYLTWFTELMDGLAVSQMYLVGNSFGGFSAAYFAMHLQERVRKLVLVGPAATIHGMLPFYIHMFVPKAFYMFFPWLPGQARVMRHSIDWMRAGLTNDNGWENLFYLVLMHGSMTSQVFPRVYTKEEFAQIKAPTLLILGEQEKIYRAKAASQAARRLLPSIQIQFIPQAHHITALANPERVNACLLQFFREGEDG